MEMTLEIHLKELREQIAQDIQNKINGVFWEQEGGETEYIPKWIAVSVVRGK